ncbi:hypothetical protein BDZ94DRAFT_1309470 [Collybia nuda]|uniref:Uncharacterized protein n=1 Tax=Collybia nuda TaxID=64659 RepID=A0A9P5Y5F0_9AGAR|nr:hypothetical protein BDZ94DRAFT_1309470 [Collybia nuda]
MPTVKSKSKGKSRALSIASDSNNSDIESINNASEGMDNLSDDLEGSLIDKFMNFLLESDHISVGYRARSSPKKFKPKGSIKLPRKQSHRTPITEDKLKLKYLHAELTNYEKAYRSIELEHITLKTKYKESLQTIKRLEREIKSLQEAYTKTSPSPKRGTKEPLSLIFRRYAKQFTALQEPFITFYSDPNLFQSKQPSLEWLNNRGLKLEKNERSQKKGWLAELYLLVPGEYHSYIGGTDFDKEVKSLIIPRH